MVPSGVGNQARLSIIELLKTQRYQFWCFGGAIKHPSYDPMQVDPTTFGDNNWIIQPVDGHGNKDLMRRTLVDFKPDVIVLFTDPRFFGWVWEMEDEIRRVCPIVYWHVWDNDPTPEFNRTIYEATDYIIPLSLKTHGILQDLKFPADRFSYVPHAEPADVFKPMSELECLEARAKTFGQFADREFIVMWNNRNARRKMTGDVMESVSLLADKVGRHRVVLLMHTAANDQEGQDIHSVAKKLGMEDILMLSETRVTPEQLNIMYNAADCVINISCFTAGTKVTTRDGFRDIDTLNVGDEVLTHRGRFRQVLKTFEHDHDGQLLKISATNCDPVYATDEHPFLAVKRSAVDFHISEHDNVNRLRELAKWTKASDLEVGDYLMSVENDLKEKEHTFDVWDSVKDDVIKTGQRYELFGDDIIYGHGPMKGGFVAKRYLKLDEDLAYILGEWVGDGATNTCMVSFNKLDTCPAALLAEKFERVFGVEAFITEEAKCLIVNSRNAAVYSKWITHVCGRYSEGKRIPSAVMAASNEIKRAFLAGYKMADGCTLTHPQYGTKVNRIRTISAALACDLREMLVSFGYCPSVKDEENTGSYKVGARIWTIEWRERKHGNNGSCRSWNDGKGVITRIYDIEVNKLEEPVKVYNIEVEEDNSYQVSSMIVHNCNEGFGLGTLEALYAGTPIVVNMTGGLQFQMGDWWCDQTDFSDQKRLDRLARSRKSTHNWWGVPVYPAARNLVGSQQVPYIYDDRVNNHDVANALLQVFKMGRTARKKLGLRAREWALEKFGMDAMAKGWDDALTKAMENHRQNRGKIGTRTAKI